MLQDSAMQIRCTLSIQGEMRAAVQWRTRYLSRAATGAISLPDFDKRTSARCNALHRPSASHVTRHSIRANERSKPRYRQVALESTDLSRHAMPAHMHCDRLQTHPNPFSLLSSLRALTHSHADVNAPKNVGEIIELGREGVIDLALTDRPREHTSRPHALKWRQVTAMREAAKNNWHEK